MKAALLLSLLALSVACFIGAASSRQLYYSYFGGDCCDDVDHNRIFNHINLQFCPAWGNDGTAAGRNGVSQRIIQCITTAQAAGIPSLIDINHLVYKEIQQGKPPLEYRWGDAVNDVYAFFTQLQELNLTRSVRAFYIVDEPERDAKLKAPLIKQVNEHMRSIMGSFRHLENASLAVIYGDREDYQGIESYDWVGFDDYDAADSIFNPGGKYDRLKAKLRPDQKTILVPGGGSPWRKSPAKMVSVALSDPKVAAVMPFLWVTKDGIGANGMAKVYCEAGFAISHPGEPSNC